MIAGWCFWCEYCRIAAGGAGQRRVGQVTRRCGDHLPGSEPPLDLVGIIRRAGLEQADGIRDRLLSLLEDHVAQLERQREPAETYLLRFPGPAFDRN